MSLTTDQKEAIQESLLAIDDPYYLNTFTDAADEDEWFRLNEAYIQDDLQRYMPAGINTHTHRQYGAASENCCGNSQLNGVTC